MKGYKLEEYFFKKPVGLKSRLKIIFYRFLGMKIGKSNRFESGNVRMLNKIYIGVNNCFSRGFFLWPEEKYSEGKYKIQIGDNNYFNKNLMIDACNKIVIGNGNMFGPDVYITDSNHTYNFGESSFSLPMDIGFVSIGSNCWIGAKVIILKDVQLGDNCIVAAGSVVTKSFPAGSLIAGVPASLKKNIE